MMVIKVLKTAIGNNAADVVKVLVENGISANAAMNHSIFGNNYTVLMYAAENNAAKVAKVLIEAGADMNAKSSSGYTALMVSTWMLKGEDVAKVLIEAGADVNIRDKTGKTVLGLVNQYDAAYLKNKKNLFLKMLKEAGAKK